MSKERDERPLAEIRFAQDCNDPEVEQTVRAKLKKAGVVWAYDIIDMGCTGLAKEIRSNLQAASVQTGVACKGPTFTEETLKGAVCAEACYIREHMSGSICGLPCYVPRDRYCLVHDTIGGLQAAGNLDGPQAARHSEALSYMSRELTEDERQKVFGVEKKINEEARKAALAEYGAVEEGTDEISDEAMPTPVLSCPIPKPPFKCPEHVEPDWECRKCIAQAVAEDRAHVANSTRVYASRSFSRSDHDGVNVSGCQGTLQGNLHEALVDLGAGRVDSVELWVRAASWSKKVTRD